MGAVVRAATGNQLPANMPSPPSYRKVNPADQPIIYLALSSPTLQLSAVDEYAETFIAQRISTINGVAQVQVISSPFKAPTHRSSTSTRLCSRRR